MIKRITILIIVAAMLTFCGCTPAKPGQGGVSIVSTCYPIYIAAINMLKGVTGATLSVLEMPKSGCLHEYSLTPDQRSHLEKAQCVLANGMGLEEFLAPIAASLPIAYVGEGFTGEDNAHIWMCIAGLKYQANGVLVALIALLPDSREALEDNYAAYVARLDACEAALMQEGIAGASVAIADPALYYLGVQLGLEMDVVMPGEEEEATPKQLSAYLDTMREKGTTLILNGLEDVSGADMLARETGAQILALETLLYGDTADMDGVIKLLKAQCDKVKEALR